MKKSDVLKMINEDKDAQFKLINNLVDSELLELYKEEYQVPEEAEKEDLQAQIKYGLSKMVIEGLLFYRPAPVVASKNITFKEVLDASGIDQKGKTFIEDYSANEVNELGELAKLSDAQKFAYYEGYNDAEKDAQMQEALEVRS